VSLFFRLTQCTSLHYRLKGLISFELNKASCQNFWEVPAHVLIMEVASDPIKDPGKTLLYQACYMRTVNCMRKNILQMILSGKARQPGQAVKVLNSESKDVAHAKLPCQMVI
jgi:hypothetical protein